MINLKVISGIISAVLGFAGMALVLFASSPAVTTTMLVVGFFGFFIMFMYGLEKALASYYDALHIYPINN